MRRSVFIAGLAVALVLGMGVFGTGRKGSVTRAQQKMSTMEVKIDNFSFGPVMLTVPVGTAVTWTNRDDISHTIVAVPGDPSRCIGISPALGCFSRVASGLPRFAASFSLPPRNVCHTNCICFIQTGKWTMPRSSKNFKAWPCRILISPSC